MESASRRTRPARERSWLRYVPVDAPEAGYMLPLGGGTRAVLFAGARYRRSLPGCLSLPQPGGGKEVHPSIRSGRKHYRVVGRLGGRETDSNGELWPS